MVIIAGAIAVTELLKMIQELYRQTYYGGVVIDTRQDTPTITSDPKFPGDMVFVIAADRKTTQYIGGQFSIDALKVALKGK
jgi:hypothetical protein